MIGLSTYSFFWQHSDRAPQPLDLPAMLHKTRELDADVFQICDYQPLLGYTAAQLRSLKALAEELGISVEQVLREAGVGGAAAGTGLVDPVRQTDHARRKRTSAQQHYNKSKGRHG